MYLRKSQLDRDFEDLTVEETLKRHKRTLEEFCKRKKIHVVKVYEEVVSGESLSARPKMLELLEQVNTGNYAGVVCMDIDRLSRGSSVDSGYITQILQINDCKIVTPDKTYDLSKESDELFTDFKFLFSRVEHKTITKRLTKGRSDSAKEGKFVGGHAPYGYEIYKLKGIKGNSLRIVPEQAKVVRMIFDMYTEMDMGYNAIMFELNRMRIPAMTTDKWSLSSIINILRNEAYIGKIRWRKEPQKKYFIDGQLVKKRYYNHDYELYDGLHEPIITVEQFEKVKELQRIRHKPPVNKEKTIQNPFAGLLFCEKCGAPMKRNTACRGDNTPPWYRCPTKSCDCKVSKVYMVEDAILMEMTKWLKNYIIEVKANETSKVADYENSLVDVQKRIEDLLHRQEELCELFESKVYSLDLFTKRNAKVEADLQQLRLDEADLSRMIIEEKAKDSSRINIIPTTQHLLDSYSYMNVEEKNALWKEVLHKVTYYKSERGGRFTIRLFPKI